MDAQKENVDRRLKNWSSYLPTRGNRELMREVRQIYLEKERCLEVVDQPLVLISQIQRSGGTLLSQLFDGHDQCLAHPAELHIGNRSKHQWPVLDTGGDADAWFTTLYHHSSIGRFFFEGYEKHAPDDRSKSRPCFLIPPALQKRLFVKALDSQHRPLTERKILNAYFTSYFGAWLDRQSSRGSKKIITAFVARMAFEDESIESFFRVYPDGRLISLIRNPASWYASAKAYREQEYGDMAKAGDLWIRNAQAILRRKRDLGSRMLVVRFENLVGDTEGTMRHLADALGIVFSRCLLVPTFNGYPMAPNSSFDVDRAGEHAIDRSENLNEEELEYMDRKTSSWYKRLLSVAEA